MDLLRLCVCILFVGIPVAGCDKLFPELSKSSADLAVLTDAGTDGSTDLGSGILTGKVCILGDLRAPASCLSAAPNRRVTIEETRASADVTADGTFTISLAGITTHATFAVTDTVAATNLSMPTVSVYSGAMLDLARAEGAALPVVPLDSFSNLQLENGATVDKTRGSLLTWLIDKKGASVVGATAAHISGSVGPLYDSQGYGNLTQTTARGAYGTVGFLDLPLGNVTLAVTTPSSSIVNGDSFTLPVRGGAVTVAALQLPAK